MEISDVRIRNVFNNHGRLKATVSIVLDGLIAIHELRVIEGPNRLFVAMPSRRDEASNDFRDIVHPITAEARQQIENIVLEAYYACLETIQSDENSQPPKEDGSANV